MSDISEIPRFINELCESFDWIENEFYMLNEENYREVVVAIREQTRVLPVDISVIIAKDVIRSAFIDRYKVKILEIAILRFLIMNDCYHLTRYHYNYHDYDYDRYADPYYDDEDYRLRFRAFDSNEHIGTTNIVKISCEEEFLGDDDADDDEVRYETNYEFMSQEIPSEWLDMVAREILESDMAEAVVNHIYADNIAMSVLGQQKVCINVRDITNWCDLPLIIPKSYRFLESMFIRDDSEIALGDRTTAGTPESFRFNDVLHRYLKRFNFETEFVCGRNHWLERS
jgi:hypothetical protein